MRHRRTTQAADAAAVTEPEFVVLLRTKHEDLARKYAALVQRLEERTAGLVAQRAAQSSVYRWALHGTAAALAVVQGGAITHRNARWDEIAGQHGRWVGEGNDPSVPFADLAEVAIHEAQRLPARAGSVTVRRYRSAGSDHIVDVRLERLESSTAPVVVLASDVTEQVRGEQELSDTREALFQSERLRVVGELAFSIAHDLGSTLRAVTTRLEVLSRDPAVRHAHADLLEGLTESAEAAVGSVRKLHDLARSGEILPGPVDLRGVLRHAVEVLRLRTPPGAPPIEVSVEVGDIPPVLGTSSELSHLFVTLLFNARDAMPSGGAIHMRAERIEDGVRVVVDDEGPGIAPEHMPHLFQPFFTTKGIAGTGLGLWLARTTMRRLGGVISARNRSGGGAEFVVDLQLARDVRRVARARGGTRRRGARTPRR